MVGSRSRPQHGVEHSERVFTYKGRPLGQAEYQIVAQGFEARRRNTA